MASCDDEGINRTGTNVSALKNDSTLTKRVPPPDPPAAETHPLTCRGETKRDKEINDRPLNYITSG